MARQAKKETKWTPTKQDSDFVNYELTKADIASLKAEFLPRYEAASAINTIVEEGYKVTLRWDDRNNCGAAWLIPTIPDDPNTGLILSGRGSTPANALIEVLFKHWVLFDKNWPRRTDQQKQKSWDE